MILRTRRILYSFFIAIFAIAAPTLVLYTAGFRYDFEYNRVVETGSLVVKSYPEKSSIYINDILQEPQTPTIINTILPGKINLLVTKDGYHSWEKTINISPRVTAFEETIKLYPKSEPKPIIKTSISNYWWNSKQDKIAYLTTKGKLRLFNTLNQKDTLIANLEKKPLINFTWSPHGDQFLFGRGSLQDEYFVVDARDNNKTIFLNSIFKSPLESLQWDPATPNSLYALSQKSLYRIPYLLQAKRLIASGDIESYLVEEDRILLSEKTLSGEFLISWIAPTDISTIHLVPEIISSKDDEFISTNSHIIAMINKKTHQLTIADPSIKNTSLENSVITIPDTRQAIWSNNGNTLIYSDGFGIYQRSFVTPITIIPTLPTSKLVIRYSQPIKNVIWADDESHIFYTINNALRVAELNSSSDPRSTVLLESEPLNNITTASQTNLATFINSNSELVAIPLSLESSRKSFLFSNE